MSTTQITIERVNNVRNHPNADRLDLVQVLGYETIVGRDQFVVGDAVVYFPPDILIPEDVAEELGVKKYLKHAIFPNDIHKTQCRVAAARLRGVPSHGFVIPAEGFVFDKETSPYGKDVTDQYRGVKYEPPVRAGAGNAASEWAIFHQYTNIENVQRFPDLIPEGTECRFTEKIHGTNCRLGLVNSPETGEPVFVAGSHRRRIKPPVCDDSSSQSIYWEPMGVKMRDLLTQLSTSMNDNVIVFGEIFGPGVQDLDYGQNIKTFRIFDISINGEYMHWAAIKMWCGRFGIETVPVLYEGPFSLEKVEELTYGETTFSGVRNKFKGREGVVVTPVVEQVSYAGRRMIVKSVSADYRDRKGATDIE